MRSTIASLLLLLMPAASSLAQDIDYPEGFGEPMRLYTEAMGDFHFPISTDSEEAQAYFDQGFQLMYSFAKEPAAHSFRASQLADPDCAICYCCLLYTSPSPRDRSLSRMPSSA